MSMGKFIASIIGRMPGSLEMEHISKGSDYEVMREAHNHDVLKDAIKKGTRVIYDCDILFADTPGNRVLLATYDELLKNMFLLKRLSKQVDSMDDPMRKSFAEHRIKEERERTEKQCQAVMLALLVARGGDE